MGLVSLGNALPHAHANGKQRRLCFCRNWRRHGRDLVGGRAELGAFAAIALEVGVDRGLVLAFAKMLC